MLALSAAHVLLACRATPSNPPEEYKEHNSNTEKIQDRRLTEKTNAENDAGATSFNDLGGREEKLERKADDSNGENLQDRHLAEETSAESDAGATSFSDLGGREEKTIKSLSESDPRHREGLIEAKLRHLLPSAIFFQHGSDVLTSEGQQILDSIASLILEVAKTVRDNGFGEIFIEVACDARTSSNKGLLSSRIRSIEIYFFEKGLDSNWFREVILAPYQKESLQFARDHLSLDSCIAKGFVDESIMKRRRASSTRRRK